MPAPETATPAKSYNHDKNAVLDYSIDYSSWLPPGDTIAESEWEVDTQGLVLGDGNNGTPAPSFDNRVTVCWLKADLNAVDGTNYLFKNSITTAQGRKADTTLEIIIQEE